MARITKNTNHLFDESLIITLNDNKIYTVPDFLEIELEKIVSITNLSYKDVVAVRKSLLIKYSAPLINGKDYYRNYIQNTAILPTGISSLDRLLEGGMLTGNILEICGFSCTAKTQFCHTIAVNVAYNLGLQVLYIDVKKDFSATRIQSITEEKQLDTDKMQKVLERIRVSETVDIHECITMLHDLSKNMYNGLRLVIIDSLPALFLPLLGDKKFSNCLMNGFVNVINFIAKKHHVIFVVVNLATRWIENENAEEVFSSNSAKQIITPALGKYWQTIPSTRLLFQMNPDNPGIINVTTMKSTNSKTGIECIMQLNEKGIF